MLWLLRAAWFTLPITAGPAASEALRGSSRPVVVVAAVLVWATWSVVLFSTLIPRPLGLTALRVAAPAAVGVALWASTRDTVSPDAAALAVLATVLASVVSALPHTGAVYVNGPAYGDERRFPLRIPPVLWLGPVPLAVALVVAGGAAGPLLLAARRIVAGAVVTAVGLPVAVALSRSLLQLARRWAVSVPAGFVLHDPLTLADPVLFPRERIVALESWPPTAAVPAGTLDIRLAALGGSLALTLTDDAQIVRARPGRRGGEVVTTSRVLFAPTRPGDLLALVARRRIATHKLPGS
jgi:hypothetical protein